MRLKLIVRAPALSPEAVIDQPVWRPTANMAVRGYGYAVERMRPGT